MGVAGLYSWLRANESELADKIDLCKTKLIIDANNLLYALYEDAICQNKDSIDFRNDVYGGNLEGYGDMVRTLFQNLKQCSIEAILVYDGSVLGKKTLSDLMSVKQREMYSRGLGQLKDMKKATDEPFRILEASSMLIKNHLLNIVFRNIANDFGIEQIVAAYEAEAIIVKLANKYNCPILSNDGDFFMYPLVRGIIHFDKHNHSNFLGPMQAEQEKISCALYHRSKLLRQFPRLDLKAIPLLSAMFGRGYDPTRSFQAIGNNLRLGRKVDYEHLRVMSGAHQRIVNFLDYLDGKSTFFAMRQLENSRVVKSFQRSQVQKTMRLFLKHFASYEDLDHQTLPDVLSQYYHEPKNVDNPKHENGNSSKHENGISSDQTPVDTQDAVKFLTNQLEKGTLTKLCLDMIFGTIQYGYRVLDDWSLPSAASLLQRPYGLALTLLRPKSPCLETFKFYDRSAQDYSMITVRPLDHLDGFGSLKDIDIYSMMKLESEQREALVMSCFHFSREDLDEFRSILSSIFSDKCVEEATLCLLLVLKYIPAESNGTKPRREYVQAILLTMLDRFAKNVGESNEVTILVETLDLRRHGHVKNNLEYLPKDNSIYRSIMHNITQLQLAYKAYNLINSLLQSPLHRPRHEKFFNGALIFRLTKLAMTGELNLDVLGGGDSSLALVEEKLLDYCEASN